MVKAESIDGIVGREGFIVGTHIRTGNRAVIDNRIRLLCKKAAGIVFGIPVVGKGCVSKTYNGRDAVIIGSGRFVFRRKEGIIDRYFRIVGNRNGIDFFLCNASSKAPEFADNNDENRDCNHCKDQVKAYFKFLFIFFHISFRSAVVRHLLQFSIKTCLIVLYIWKDCPVLCKIFNKK